MDATVLTDDYWWPTSERLPLPESEDHLNETIYLVQALRAHFRGFPNVSVKAGLFIFHVHGGPVAHLEPDIFVVKDALQEAHSLYQLCMHEKPPCMVIEITSARTVDEDLSTKKDLYERIGIPEYFLYDVRGETLKPSLQGYRWADGRYEAMAERTGL